VALTKASLDKEPELPTYEVSAVQSKGIGMAMQVLVITVGR